ncbi:MAG: citrate lyase subunit beta / citryl-CoA lyase, partial [Mycobacterium sp.]|nr:citrate lyase subunit beta / citryl-CoA lyase [Mycobacterium sp.]
MGLGNPGPAWLFCPADRSERYHKAAAVADVVILDLEDGCAPADRPAARRALVDVQLDPARTVVRVNQFGTEDQRLDLEALEKTPYDTVMLPKCEAVYEISALAPLDVIVLVESPKGALIVTDTVQVDNAVAVMWGAEDLFAVLGGTANRYLDGTYREVA